MSLILKWLVVGDRPSEHQRGYLWASSEHSKGTPISELQGYVEWPFEETEFDVGARDYLSKIGG